MILYEPFQKREQEKRFKRNGVRLILLCILCIVVSTWWVISSDQAPPDTAISSLPSVKKKPISSSKIVPSISPSPFRSEIYLKKAVAEAKTILPKEDFRKVKGTLSKGDTLYQALLNKNIKKETINTIIKHLKPILPLRSIMPGDTFVLTLDEDHELDHFEYCSGPMGTYLIEKQPDGTLDSFKKKVELHKYWAVVAGVVEGSLFNSLAAAGEDTSLASKFADIFAWRIDFHNELRKGDKFKMVIEKYYAGDKFIRYGEILGAEYNGYCGLHQAILFEDDFGNKDYYDLNGCSLKRAFLRAPLRFNYISSGYTYHRPHPILGYVRPHLGIDYAAPAGSPVWSVADGEIVSAQYEGGNGNQVIIKHMNGYQSYYNHLSGFGRGIKKGVRVKQQQVIGYVGTTGLSTGPHLDYRVKHKGNFINPLKNEFPTGQKLETASKKVFHQTAYNLLHFMYDNVKEKMICKVLEND